MRRETFAGEMLGRTIVIENVPEPGRPPTAWLTKICFQDTGEVIENVSEIAIAFKASGIITAELTLVHIHPYQGSLEGIFEEGIQEEKVVTENPELHLHAVVAKEIHRIEEAPE